MLNIRSLFFSLIGVSFVGSAFGQENAGDPRFLDNMERDAKVQLEAAYKAKDYKLLKEAAEELEKIAATRRGIANPQPKKLGVSFLDELRTHGLSLRLGTGDAEDKPARFAFSKDIRAKTDTQFTADFYLKWQNPIPYRKENFTRSMDLFYQPAVSVQGKLLSSDDTKSDAWKFRIENKFFTYNKAEHRIVDGFILTLNAKEESDRDFEVARVGGEAWATLNSFGVFIGKYSGEEVKGKLPPIQFRWRPYVGADIGDTVAGRETIESSSRSWARLMGRVTLDLRLNFLSDAFRLNEVIAYADGTEFYLAEEGRSFGYLRTGINFSFNDAVGLGLEYKVGKDAPKFLGEESLSGAFTVKF